MPDTPFLQRTQYGIYCAAGDFYIDPNEPVARAVITHAHADHACKGNGEVYCTRPTSAFMQFRYGKSAAKTFHTFFYRENFRLKDVDLEFIPAGHILGSAQIMMRWNGMRYLFTGDFKLAPDASCEPFEFEAADVLITETTFANPEFIHPDASEEIKKLNADDTNILLGTYSLGKAQRLTQLITGHCPHKNILLHHRIYPYHKLYEKLGAKTGTYQVYDRRQMKQHTGQIYLVPPFTFESYFRAVNVKKMFATGWKEKQKQNDDTLFISDHADWQEILQLIDQVKPGEIITHHGDGRFLKAYFAGKILVNDLDNAG